VYPGGEVKRVAYMLGKLPDPDISVDLARLTSKEESVGRAKKPGYGLGEIITGYPRSQGLTVEHNPVEGNDSHSLITGCASKVMCKNLAENTLVVVDPEPQV
jgi:hypothetical protein